MAAHIQRADDPEENAPTRKAPIIAFDTNVVDRTGNLYRPKKWQSNVTILSCVCLNPRPGTPRCNRSLTSIVYRKLQ